MTKIPKTDHLSIQRKKTHKYPDIKVSRQRFKNNYLCLICQKLEEKMENR